MSDYRITEQISRLAQDHVKYLEKMILKGEYHRNAYTVLIIIIPSSHDHHVKLYYDDDAPSWIRIMVDEAHLTAGIIIRSVKSFQVCSQIRQ